ncbi:MAG: cysteine desulfurase [Alphaproteobacteria bacterium]|nr:cysteine desulfurase [Alphaproteobacteria bacterium]
MAEIATYLDYNATAPIKPAVREAVEAALGKVGNPSSIHRFGRALRDEVEAARERVARLVGGRPEHLVFTSGGTEANHLALQGAGVARHLMSAVEHDSIRNALAGPETVPVDADGRVDLAALETLLNARPEPALVSIMAVNNETGVVEPIAEAARIVHAHGSRLLVDAVQAAGKVAIDLQAQGADYLTLSAHKLGGPTGVGALVLGADVPYTVPVSGAGQERGRRPGTENVPGIVGFGVAADLAAAALEDFGNIGALRDRLENGIARIAKDAVVFGRVAPRVSNTSLIAMPGVSSETQLVAFDLDGFAVSAGSACSSGKVDPSHVLLAMGVEKAVAETAIRVSLGWDTKPDDIEGFLKAWESLYARTRGRKVSAA